MLLKRDWRKLFLAIPYWMRVEDYLPRLDKSIPVFEDQILPTIGSITVMANVGVEEMRISNDPGFLIQNKTFDFVIGFNYSAHDTCP